MGLLDLFNQWIVERGSAAVQEKQLSLFRDQLVIADKRISELESENAVLKAQVGKFKSESDNLRIANNELYSKIQIYEKSSQNNLLDEPKINILKLLFSHDKLTTEQVAASQQLQLQTAQYHLVELANLGMASSQRFSQQIPGAGPFDFSSLRRYSAWIIMQPGRKYLLDNKLVS